MAKSSQNLTPEQVVASSGRDMGMVLPRPSGGSDFSHEQVRPRNTGAAGDPALWPTQGRNPVINENIGAAYRGIPMGRSVEDPAIGPTNAFHGKTFAPSVSRDDSFKAGADY